MLASLIRGGMGIRTIGLVSKSNHFKIPKYALASAPLSYKRFNSSSAGNGAPEAVSEITTQLKSFGETAIDAATTMTSDQLGYMHSIGLANGWTPSPACQQLLEYVHVFSGAPWWLTIIGTTLGVRLLLFPAAIKGADASARSQAANKEFDPSQLRAAQTTMEAQRLRAQQKVVYAKHGVKFRHLLFPFLQIIFAWGMFNGLRHMAEYPVDGLSTQGYAWFPDLTVVDPYYGLQAFSAFTFALMFWAMKDALPPIMKKIGIIMPIGGFLFATSLNSAIVLFLCTNSVFSTVQSAMFRSPAMRKALKMYPLPVPKVGEKNKNVMELMSESIEKLQKNSAAKASQQMQVQKAHATQAARGDQRFAIVKKPKVRKD
ncbi:unnamed protein product [Kuraishia capsulata CBS 1993]|uniref:Membrane insertase YidC/Oxa/ALB C-terminal domain-containing protein n=1 Tax=Kuraishia capsulata CBS 1993 TaxID=1382522 RepID=W6MK97_9ASCO|nr:uncharacterized protein KUCA_T00002931001 [Kuraishia capsulata CBS 1993]CDK26954.1 unnamed protein product [Kuraishia capsulata CBS 1993]